MFQINLRDFIEPIELNNENVYGETYVTKDKIFIDCMSDVKKLRPDERVAYATDYAVMNGAFLAGSSSGHKSKPPAWYFLRTIDKDTYLNYVASNGELKFYDGTRADHSIRPRIRLNLNYFESVLLNIPSFTEIEEVSKGKGESFFTLTFGEYPKDFVGREQNTLLENAFKNGELSPTGRFWPGYKINRNEIIQHPEYFFGNEKVTRVRTRRAGLTSEYASGTKLPFEGQFQWALTQPLVWKILNWEEMPLSINSNGNSTASFIDLQTEECIASGLPYIHRADSSLWESSLIRQFLNDEFLTKAFPPFKFKMQNAEEFFCQ